MGNGAVGGDPRRKSPQGRISAKTGQGPPQREIDFLSQFLSQMRIGFIAEGDTLYHGAMVPRDLIEGLPGRHGCKAEPFRPPSGQ
jgi:hypothetical protein